MTIRAGTSGYSYKEWKGPFYPETLPAKQMLSFYAQQLSTVEINNTFYRMPKQSVLETWASQVPESFRFAVKASRRITHFKRLKGVAEETGFLLENLAVLGERLGTVLFQLPPNLKLDLERLDVFLELIPEGVPVCFEFRHPSWSDEPVRERLAARGCAWVLVDSEDGEAPLLVGTGDFRYLRLRRPSYTREELAAWAQRLAGEEVDRAFVFFKHEDAGAGPALAARFMEIVARGSQRKPAQAKPAPAGRKRKAG